MKKMIQTRVKRDLSMSSALAGFGLWVVAGTTSAASVPNAEPVATRRPVSAPAVVRSERTYALPLKLRLQRADGASLSLQDALYDSRPVVLTFMYSSCATVCPITSQALVEFEQLLGGAQTQVNTVAISIDPDHDSVRRLADHARRTGARGSLYTGDPGSSEAIQRAFDAWRGDKMNHQAVFFMAAGPGKPWVRLDGLVTPQLLLSEYRRLLAANE